MAQLHTGWHVNTKVLGVGLQGMGLHAWSISYCDHARSDGFIPAGAWPALPGVKAAVFALLRAGLWEAVAGGFQVHDYRKYNRLRAQIDAEQQATNARQSRHRSRVTDTVSDAVTNTVSHTVPPRAGAPNPNPGLTPGLPARLAGRFARVDAPARAREPDLQPVATFLPDDLPDEVLERLGRPPIGQPALPASPSNLSQEYGGALG